jgi:hypothetical protein
MRIAYGNCILRRMVTTRQGSHFSPFQPQATNSDGYVVAGKWQRHIETSLDAWIMSRKKSDNKSVSHERDTTPSEHAPRPIALLGMALVAGAASTWYWYRPLPKEALERAHRSVPTASVAAPVPNPFASQDRGLIAPTLAKTDAAPDPLLPIDDSAIRSENAPPEALTGPADLALTPYHERIRPIQEWLAGEPLPMVPMDQPLSDRHRSLPQAKLWTSALADGSHAPNKAMPLAANPPNGIPPNEIPPETLDAASPFRVPSVTGTAKRTEISPLLTDIWPDQGFEPSNRDQRLSPGPSSAGALAHSQGGHARLDQDSMKSVSGNRIRTLDRDHEGGPVPPPVLPASTPPPSATSTPSPPAPSERIRQPRPPQES